jgi:NADPH2:quinone reductase
LDEEIAEAHAIVMRTTGPPDVLRMELLPVFKPAPSEIRIRMLAAAVNHSDLEIRAGSWPIRRESPFPYVPGLEVVGEVVETGAAVESIVVGERVMTMMQGLGGVSSLRPGGYQEYVTVDADAVAPVPDNVEALGAAALGLAAVTAHQGLELVGPLDGRRVAVTGAAGGVGSAAVALAAAGGAEVVAIVRDATRAEHLKTLGAAEVVDDVSKISVGSLHGVLDTVAGSLFERLVGALQDRGVLSLVGAMSGGRVTFDAWHLTRGVVLTGYSSEDLDGPSLRRAAADVFALLQAGKLAPPPSQTLPLEQASEAHRLLEKGAASRGASFSSPPDLGYD